MQNLKDTAERLYAQAVQYKNQGNVEQARQLGLAAIAIYETMEFPTLESALSMNNRIDGIVIPDFMHDGVVRKRLDL